MKPYQDPSMTDQEINEAFREYLDEVGVKEFKYYKDSEFGPEWFGFIWIFISSSFLTYGLLAHLWDFPLVTLNVGCVGFCFGFLGLMAACYWIIGSLWLALQCFAGRWNFFREAVLGWTQSSDLKTFHRRYSLTEVLKTTAFWRIQQGLEQQIMLDSMKTTVEARSAEQLNEEKAQAVSFLKKTNPNLLKESIRAEMYSEIEAQVRKELEQSGIQNL